MPKRKRSSARRAWESPASAWRSAATSTRSKPYLYTGMLIVLASPVVLFIAGLTPLYPDRWLILFLTLTWGMLCLMFTYKFLAYSNLSRLRKVALAGLVTFAAASIGYIAFLIEFTVPAPGYPGRVPVSHQLSPERSIYLSTHPGMTLVDLLQAESWDLEKVFTSSSLAIVRTVQLVVWFLMYLSIGVVLASYILGVNRRRAYGSDPVRLVESPKAEDM